MKHILSGYSDDRHKAEAKKKDAQKLHSPAHLLAAEITQKWNEPKKFGMYLGVINRVGIDRARQIYAELNQRDDISPESRVKLFMWNSKQNKDKPEN